MHVPIKSKPTYHVGADIVRSIAGIGVIVLHTSFPFFYYPPFFGTPAYFFSSFVVAVTSISVPLFILLSGFLNIKPIQGSYQDFYGKKARRVVFPLIFWSLFYLVWRMVFLRQRLRIIPIIREFVMGGYFHLYYLYLIIGLYLITPFIVKFLTSPKRKIAVILFFLLLGMGNAVSGFFVKGTYIFATAVTIFIPYIGYYVAGDLFKKLTLTKKKRIMFLLLYLAVLVSSFILNFQLMKAMGWSRTIPKVTTDNGYLYSYFSLNVMVMAFTMFPLLLHIANHINLSKRATENIKAFSSLIFGAYLFHPAVLDVVNKYTFLDLSRIHTPVVLYFFVKVFLVLTVTFISVFIGKKIYDRTNS